MTAMGEVVLLSLNKISICFWHTMILAERVYSLKRKKGHKKALQRGYSEPKTTLTTYRK
jgi:hypothetical protein